MIFGSLYQSDSDADSDSENWKARGSEERSARFSGRLPASLRRHRAERSSHAQQVRGSSVAHRQCPVSGLTRGFKHSVFNPLAMIQVEKENLTRNR